MQVHSELNTLPTVDEKTYVANNILSILIVRQSAVSLL